MVQLSPLLLVAYLLAAGSAAPLEPRDAAIRDAPSKSYTPSRGVCPKALAVRRSNVQGFPLNNDEASYISKKSLTSVPAWSAYLKNVNLAGLNVSSFTAVHKNGLPSLPNVGFAVSGGGYRALLYGASVLSAFDSRNASSVKAGTGGIMQLAAYSAGLSGGSWMTGTWALNNFPTFESLRDQVWDFENSLLLPQPSRPTLVQDVTTTTVGKAAAGYPVSFIDIYGRNLCYHLLNDTVAQYPGSQTMWHSIRDTPNFQKHLAPFPIILTVGLQQGQYNTSLKSPIYEINPYEFYVNHPTIGGAAIPIDYLGTSFKKGAVSDNQCTTGFENAGLMMGGSGDIFGNAAQSYEDPLTTQTPALAVVLNAVPQNLITTLRIPNPFQVLNASTWPASGNAELNLLDGGLGGGEVTPYFPLLNKARALDVIIAMDSDAETNNYPSGASIYASYVKSTLPGYESYTMPIIPNPTKFVALGLNTRPVFFGSTCTNSGPSTPLIVYLPNYFVSYPTNTQTLQVQYSKDQQLGFFQNGFDLATQSHESRNSSTVAPKWSTCLACALVDAQGKRNGAARSAECGKCFAKYCYTGGP